MDLVRISPENFSREEHKTNNISYNRVVSTVINLEDIYEENLGNQENHPLLNNPTEKAEYRSSSSECGVPCSICQISSSTYLIFIETCDHLFCRPCIYEYLKIRIEESQVLTMPCPYDQCPSQILDSEIEKIVSLELYNKFLRFKKVEELNKEPFLRWCPKPDCEGYDKGSLKVSKLECNICKHKYCFYCGKAWHRWRKCKFSEDKEMDKWAKQNGIKYCPNCKRKVEKMAGCEHLTCPKCRYEWCWVCGGRFTHGHICNVVVPAIIEDNQTIEIIACFFAPIFLVSIGLTLSILCVYVFLKKIDDGEINEYRVSKKYRKSLYFFAFIFGLLLNYFIFIIVLYVFTFMLVGKIHKKLEGKQVIRILLSTLLFPFIIILICCSFILSPLRGIFMIFKKIYYAIKNRNSPRIVNQSNLYGYN